MFHTHNLDYYTWSCKKWEHLSFEIEDWAENKIKLLLRSNLRNVQDTVLIIKDDKELIQCVQNSESTEKKEAGYGGKHWYWDKSEEDLNISLE